MRVRRVSLKLFDLCYGSFCKATMRTDVLTLLEKWDKRGEHEEGVYRGRLQLSARGISTNSNVSVSVHAWRCNAACLLNTRALVMYLSITCVYIIALSVMTQFYITFRPGRESGVCECTVYRLSSLRNRWINNRRKARMWRDQHRWASKLM